MILGRDTGSVVNHLLAGGNTQCPRVGDGVTILGWTDRYAGTIIKVTPKMITVREDIATRTDSNGLSEAQVYRYEPNPNGRTRTFRLTRDGWRTKDREGLSIGVRRAYRDPSF